MLAKIIAKALRSAQDFDLFAEPTKEAPKNIPSTESPSSSQNSILDELGYSSRQKELMSKETKQEILSKSIPASGVSILKDGRIVRF